METNSISTKKAQLTIIFLTVFIYLVGFGIIIPVIPILSRDFGATPLQTGLLLAVYSAMQFFFSPFWGKLSDRFGRRPILIFCLFGEGLSYLLFAYARSLEVLFIARIFAGFFGASLSTASAYISDITPPNERSKGMALIGAAFGLGFVVGPALGGGLALWGQHISPEKHFDTSFAALWVAGICFANFFFALKYLTESLKLSAHKAEKKKRFSVMFHYFSIRTVGPLMTVFMLSSLAMSSMEATLILFMGERFQWDVKQVSFGFAYIGLIIVFTQGFLVRRLLPLWGERKVLRVGLLSLAVGLTSIALAHDVYMMAFAMTFLSLGNGLSNPAILGGISLLVNPREQGAAMGVTQSMSSLGRILGPVLGGFLYGYMAITAPFWASGLLAFTGFAIVLFIYNRIPNQGKTAEKTPQALNEIGLFQFNNLVQTRIPFLFVNLGANIEGVFSGQAQAHLENHTISGGRSEMISTIEARKLLLEHAIVILSEDGRDAGQMAQELEQKNYTNVYVIRDGLRGLKSESPS